MLTMLTKTCLAAVNRVRPAHGGRGYGIRIDVADDSIAFTAYDGDLMLRIDLDAGQGVAGDVAATHGVYPLAALTRMLAVMPDEVTVAIDEVDGTLHLRGLYGDVQLMSSPRGEGIGRNYKREGVPLPVVDMRDEDVVFTSTETFVEAITFAASAASADGMRPILTQVYFDTTDVAGTDSYRLAYMPHDAEIPEGKYMMPATAARFVGPASVLHRNGQHWSWRNDDLTVHVRSAEGDFPNWRQLVRQGGSVIDVDRQAMISRVQVARSLAKMSYAATVKIGYGDGERLTIAAATQDVGAASSTIDGVVFEGAEGTIAFNPGFLLDGMKAVKGDRLRLTVIDPLKPATIERPDGGGYLLMPVRTS